MKRRCNLPLFALLGLEIAHRIWMVDYTPRVSLFFAWWPIGRIDSYFIKSSIFY
jgi:hypothetical protein